MRLTDHDLKQLNQAYLESLLPEQLLYLSGKMLDDLRDARDRLNQTPQSSSRPSGSYAPWEQAGFGDEKGTCDEASDAAEEGEVETQAGEEGQAAGSEGQEDTDESVPESSGKRKAGKQAGAKGVGRRVEMAVTGEEVHAAQTCAGCGACLAEEVPFRATTGMYVLDLEREEQGIAIVIQGIYQARDGPESDLPAQFSQELDQLRELCQQHRDHSHEKPENWPENCSMIGKQFGLCSTTLSCPSPTIRLPLSHFRLDPDFLRGVNDYNVTYFVHHAGSDLTDGLFCRQPSMNCLLSWKTTNSWL